MNRVTQRGPVAYALLASLLAHACGLAWLLTRPELITPAAPDNALSVVLQRAEPPAAEDPEPAPEPDQPPQPEVAQQPKPAVETAVAVEAPVAAEPEPTTRPRLNLSRPKDWDALATESPEALTSFGFKNSNRRAIAQRQEERARTRVLTRAQLARLGLPQEDYRRRTDEGEEVKTAKGCFVKRVENGPNGHSERWWRTKCRDTKVSAWRREVLTFGADHRVATDTPADFESPDAGVEP